MKSCPDVLKISAENSYITCCIAVPSVHIMWCMNY